MEVTDLPLPPGIWAATPCAAQTLIVAQRERIRDLEAQLGQNSANSSRPPSSDPPQAPAKRRPQYSGRKRGGQPGHRGGCRGLLPVEKTAGLCRELTKWWTTLWAFARVGGVEPTNNVPERALRPAVLWRKGSVGADSTAGSCFVERLLTVIATCRQRGRRLLEFLVAAGDAAVRGGPPPSLISAPPGG